MVFEAACGLLDLDPSRCDPKRGQREAADELSVPHSEGKVFEVKRALQACIQHART